MKRMIAFIAAGFLAASLGAPSVMAQTKETARTPTTGTSTMEQKSMADTGHSIEGRVKSVNMFHTKLTLEDGTQLTIPKSVKPPKEAFKKKRHGVGVVRGKGRQESHHLDPRQNHAAVLAHSQCGGGPGISPGPPMLRRPVPPRRHGLDDLDRAH